MRHAFKRAVIFQTKIYIYYIGILMSRKRLLR